MAKIPHFSFLGLVLAMKLLPWVLAQPTDPGVVLDERIMKLSVESAKLSFLAYANATDYAVGVDENGVTLYEHPDYESIYFYNDEPDQAIVAKTKDSGRCYLAFRGTTLDIADWLQNTGLGSIDIYKDNNNSTGESCSARGGFADFLLSDLVGQGGVDLIACADTCADPEDCIVLTGHSQGGATSLLAAILLHTFNPMVFTFGQPLAIQRNCDLIRSERVYRYVNSLLLDDEIAYDPVPLIPAFGQGRGHYGYYLLLGDDTTALKFLGVDGEDSGFSPGPQLSGTPHTMGAGPDFSYEARVTALFDNNVFPVPTDGFFGGVPCDEFNPLLCASDFCGAVDMVCTTASTPPSVSAEPTMGPSIRSSIFRNPASSSSFAEPSMGPIISFPTTNMPESTEETSSAIQVRIASLVSVLVYIFGSLFL